MLLLVEWYDVHPFVTIEMYRPACTSSTLSGSTTVVTALSGLYLCCLRTTGPIKLLDHLYSFSAFYEYFGHIW